MWLEMQDKGPFSRAAFARRLTNRYDFPITHQSVSNYLRREHPPAEFMGKAVKALRDLGMPAEREHEIYQLYFGRAQASLTEAHKRRAEEIEEEGEKNGEFEDPQR